MHCCTTTANDRWYAFGLDNTCRFWGAIEFRDEFAGEMVEARSSIQAFCGGYVSCGWIGKKLTIQIPLNLSLFVASFHITLEILYTFILLTDIVARWWEIWSLKSCNILRILQQIHGWMDVDGANTVGMHNEWLTHLRCLDKQRLSCIALDCKKYICTSPGHLLWCWLIEQSSYCCSQAEIFESCSCICHRSLQSCCILTPALCLVLPSATETPCPNFSLGSCMAEGHCVLRHLWWSSSSYHDLQQKRQSAISPVTPALFKMYF